MFEDYDVIVAYLDNSNNFKIHSFKSFSIALNTKDLSAYDMAWYGQPPS